MLFDQGRKYKFAFERQPKVSDFLELADKMRELKLKGETPLEEHFRVNSEGMGFVFAEMEETTDSEEESAKD